MKTKQREVSAKLSKNAIGSKAAKTSFSGYMFSISAALFLCTGVAWGYPEYMYCVLSTDQPPLLQKNSSLKTAKFLNAIIPHKCKSNEKFCSIITWERPDSKSHLVTNLGFSNTIPLYLDWSEGNSRSYPLSFQLGKNGERVIFPSTDKDTPNNRVVHIQGMSVNGIGNPFIFEIKPMEFTNKNIEKPIKEQWMLWVKAASHDELANMYEEVDHRDKDGDIPNPFNSPEELDEMSKGYLHTHLSDMHFAPAFIMQCEVSAHPVPVNEIPALELSLQEQFKNTPKK